MASFDVSFNDLTEDELSALMEWWQNGRGKSKGVRFVLGDPAASFRSQGYKPRPTQNSITREMGGPLPGKIFYKVGDGDN